MDKDESFKQAEKYAKRLLDRSQYSDCYSNTYRKRLSVLEALSKASVIPTSIRNYDGNPFEKEFSEVNKATASVGEATAAACAAAMNDNDAKDDDQLEMTYVSTWPEDNTDVSTTRTYGDDEQRDSLVCVESHDDQATNHTATEYRSSEQFRQDIVDTDVESVDTKSTLTMSHDYAGERFGPLTSSELKLQSKLNRKYEKEFRKTNARLERHGVDKFFGTESTESCEPRIIELHRKSCDSEAVATQTNEADSTYVKDETVTKSWIETDLDEAPSLSSCSSDDHVNIPANANGYTYIKEDNNEDLDESNLGSEYMRDLDNEFDKLDFEDDNDDSDKKTAALPILAKGAVGKIKGSSKRDQAEKSYGDIESGSPKNATYSVAPENSISKTASFIKRHTSFLFKNLLTPKLRRRKSNAESSRGASSKVNANGLIRSNTMGSSDNGKPGTRLQHQFQQVHNELPPDVDDTVTTEMENFLKVAAENSGYNSTMVQTHLESRDRTYSLVSSDGDYSRKKRMKEPKSEPSKRSGTLNRTLSMYKTLTQRIRDKFRRYEHYDSEPLPTFDQLNIPEDLSPEVRIKIRRLQEQVNYQDTMIHQTSKALHLCESMREFTASTERVELDRLLLLSSVTKKAILRKINRLMNERAYNNNEAHASCSERGEVKLEKIRLQIREDVMRRVNLNYDIVEYFLVLVVHDDHVWASNAIACPTASPEIYFEDSYIISGLTPDFRLSVRIYSLTLQQQLYQHDEMYHLAKNLTFGPGIKIKTPKMLRKKQSISPKHYKVKYMGVKETSFVYCGGVDLMLYDLKLQSPWPLSSLSPNTVLHGTIDLNLSCRLTLSVFHVGFLTHCEETGDLAWSRRWCLLEGHTLMFWNYPREQEYNPPLYSIDLVNCVSDRVEQIDRQLCPKPRTLLLETRSKPNEKRNVIVDSKTAVPVHRHLLSCDNNDELTEWHKQLNHVVSALSDWNIIHTAHNS